MSASNQPTNQSVCDVESETATTTIDQVEFKSPQLSTSSLTAAVLPCKPQAEMWLRGGSECDDINNTNANR